MPNLPMVHRPDCASIISRSQFDKFCPRCEKVWKVVMLRRKRLTLGSSIDESQSAESAAQAIIVRYGLSHAECIDRAYVRATTLARTVAAPRRRSGASGASRASRAYKGLIVDDFVDMDK